jgi:hypothetical protein
MSRVLNEASIMVSALASKVGALAQAQRDMQRLLDQLASSAAAHPTSSSTASACNSSSPDVASSPSTVFKVHGAVPSDSRAATAVGSAAAAAAAAVAAVTTAPSAEEGAESSRNEVDAEMGAETTEAMAVSPGSKRKVEAT